MEPIAIVGLSFRLPQGIVDERELWTVLKDRVNVSTDWPPERGILDSFFDHNTTHSRGGHFLAEDPALFDAPFFAITAKEAAQTDPQQRMALEATYHAFENAGLILEDVRGSKTAVFSATMSDDYSRLGTKDFDGAPTVYSVTGWQPSILPSRVSWYFDLRGPSVHIDTACSGTMVALEMACQAIRGGSATMAVVIGANLLLAPETSVLLDQAKFLSPDSKCFSFDAKANGYARGEGIVAFVIKPLTDSVRDGHVVRAVIRGIGSNQDGRTATLTHPSPESQETLIRRVYAEAGLEYDTTRYFEAHGTGTPVGDPIELTAIGSVFKNCRSVLDPLFVGSIKSNIGHLEGASGGAGILKAILALEKGVVPPTALFETINPNVDADSLGIKVPTRQIAWPASGLRRASVNSFGYGGTNSHLILDDAFHYLNSREMTGFHHCDILPNGDHTSSIVRKQQQEGSGDTDTESASSTTVPEQYLLVWSAAEKGALQRLTNNYQDYFHDNITGDGIALSQLAYTLAARRSLMPWRTFALVSRNEVEQPFPSRDRVNPLSFSPLMRIPNEDVNAAFIFTGQGAQYSQMGLSLLQYPTFETSLKKSDEVIASLGSTWSIIDQLRSDNNISHPGYSQPLSTALQIALVDLLRSMGVVPVAVVGHSSGEIAAAYTSGALSHESACAVAYFRGLLSAHLHDTAEVQGAMISVNLSEDEAQGYVSRLNHNSEFDQICIACINSPQNVTLSGHASVIDIVKSELDEMGVFAQKLNTGIAYHSPAVRAVAAEYLASMSSVMDSLGDDHGNTVTMISSVTGSIVSPESLRDPQYWVDNLVSPVRFSEAVEKVTKVTPVSSSMRKTRSITDLIEIGPHPALKRSIKDSLVSPLRYHFTLKRNDPPVPTILNLLGTLFCNGYPVSVLTGNVQQKNCLPYLINCPPYPFDHTRRYWTEPRLSRELRLRPKVSGYVLGRRAHDHVHLRPRWRNWLSTQTIPWLKDHVVSRQQLFPGMGMIVAAIEAVKQIVNTDDRVISSFVFRNVRFMAPIQVPDAPQTPTEIVLEATPLRKTVDKELTSFGISIFAYYNERWSDCFQATVQAHYEPNVATPVDGGKEDRLDHDLIRDEFNRVAASCVKPIDKRAFYDFCEEHGLEYGSEFQLLQNIAWDGHNNAIAEINIRPRENHERIDSPVHPAVMDAGSQLIIATISRGLSDHISTIVPQKMDQMWISAKIWQEITSTVRIASVRASAVDLDDNPTTVTTSTKVLASDGTVLCAVNRFTSSEISRYSPQQGARNDDALLYNTTWKPQLTRLSSRMLSEYCSNAVKPDDKTSVTLDAPMIESALRNAARKALQIVTDEELDVAPAHMRRYARALRYHYVSSPRAEGDDLSEAALDHLLSQCEQNPATRAFSKVAHALPDILRGRTDPLDLLYAMKDAENLYNDLADQQMRDGQFAAFLDLLSHEKPNLKILELGAGTGSMSRQIISVLQRLEQETGQTRFASYTYTDISPGFFEAAKSSLGLESRLHFQTLDVEYDPGQQSFELESYDFIVVGLMLHATSDPLAALARLRHLLQPGGYIAFQEVVVPRSARANVTFGCLQGWWLDTTGSREYTPLLDETEWGELLTKAGFTGPEMILRDHQTHDSHLCSMFVSRVPLSTGCEAETNGLKTPNLNRIVIIVDKCSPPQHEMALYIAERYSNTQRVLLPEAASETCDISSNDVVVCLLELGASLLSDISTRDFQAVQNVARTVQNLLWVSSLPVTEDGLINPFASLATGLLRTIRSEEDEKPIVTLNIEGGTPQVTADAVFQLLDTWFTNKDASREVEYIVRDGKIMIGRLVQEVELDTKRHLSVTPKLRVEPWESGPPLALQIGEPGLLNTLRFVEDQQYANDLESNHVEVKTTVCPLSFRDIFVALGRMGRDLGVECAGIVTRVGESCPYDLKPGDRVVMLSIGCMRTYVRSVADLVVKIPDSLDSQEAIASINPGITAYHSLTNIAQLKRGEKILIHSGAGSTGQMAIGLAQRIGAEVYTTVGNNSKKQLLMDRFGLPEDHIFFSRDTSFAKGVMRITRGYGVDVVLNSLSGESLRASATCLAPYGRFIEIGKADIMADSRLPMGSFSKNNMFATVDMIHIARTDQKLFRQLMTTVLDLLTRGAVGGPLPLHAYPFSEVEKAFRYMQSGTNTGRILLLGNEGDMVPKFMTHNRRWSFDPSASYVVAGGFGGIGRAILRWMAAKGARHLIVPSRSQASSQAAQELVMELAVAGVRIESSPCDVTSAAELETLLDKCSSTWPPIKGCINAIMLLQDAVFGNMSHAQWSRGLRAKVDASWNLHRSLPQNMDFFILLSSLAGIYGSSGQGNYCAGCTFQDALARSRTAAGYRGSVSIDLGWMRTIGVIAENEEYRRNRRGLSDMGQVEEADLLAVLNHYCDPSGPSHDADRSQVMVGVVTPAHFRARGEGVPSMMERSLFAGFNASSSMQGDTVNTGGPMGGSPGRLLQQMSTTVERGAVVEEALKGKLARSLDVAAEDIDTRQTLSAYSADSLVAVELRNWIRKEFGVSVAVYELIGGADIKAVSWLIAERSEESKEAAWDAE